MVQPNYSACHWLGDLAWFKRLNTPYRDTFVAAQEVPLVEDEVGGAGSVQQVGGGAGLYTFVKMENAGHRTSIVSTSVHDISATITNLVGFVAVVVEFDEPALVLNLMDRWIRNQTFH